MAFLPRLVLNPGSLLLAQHVDNVQSEQRKGAKAARASAARASPKESLT